MTHPEMTNLESFHIFVGKQLASETAVLMSPEEAIALWREEQDTLTAIREGLEDVSKGRTKSLEEFDQDFRQRHDFKGTT